MTTGLELVQWALWWMAEQRRQYILNMRKALYYLDRRIVMGLTSAIYPTLPGSFGPQPNTPVWLTRRRDWRRNLRIANWIITETHTKLGPGY